LASLLFTLALIELKLFRHLYLQQHNNEGR
jgi:hypothetical protein